MRLHYIQGSPFARTARVLLREFAIPCEECLIEDFPPPASYFSINPLGQVPALEDDGSNYFPTISVLKHLAGLAQSRGVPPGGLSPTLHRDGHRSSDDQLLMVLLAMGDMMVAVQYQKWAGTGLGGNNVLGYVPSERNMTRITHTLNWLEQQTQAGGFWPSAMCVQDVVLACLMLWSDSRGPIPWRGRPGLEQIVAKLAPRPSFTATAPLPLPPEFAA